MYSAMFGSLKFTQWQGDPLLAQTVWEQEERAGVPGVIFADAGLSAEPFTAEIMADCPTYADAHEYARALQAAVSLPPQQLVIAGYTSFPNFFKLVRVGQPHVESILWGTGGLCDEWPGGPFSAQAIVTARLMLREFIPGSI